jgi:hypothetical protein
MTKNNVLSKEAEENLREIKSLVKVTAGYFAMQQIEKIVSTDERKAVWFVCTGKLTREGIVRKSGVSMRTVTSFIDLAKTLGLLEEEKEKGGHPRRVIDYAPPEWKKLLKPKKKTAETTKAEPSPPTT